MSEKLKIRLAKLSDAKQIFELSNDTTVRKNSIHQEKIKWENHITWFKEKINSKDSLFYIGETNNCFAGYLRLDKDDKNWVTTIHITKDCRNKGIGSTFINFVCDINKDKNIVAFVKISNIASYKSFIKANFRIENEMQIDNQKYWLLGKRKFEYNSNK